MKINGNPFTGEVSFTVDGDTTTAVPGNPDVNPPNVEVSNPLSGIGDTLQRIAGNVTAILLAVVLLALGVVILLRMPIAGATPVGKVAKGLKAVAK